MPIRRLIGFVCLLSVATFAISSDQEDPARQPGQNSELPGVVFVGAPIFDEHTEGGDSYYQGSYHWRDGYVYARSATYHRAERTTGPVRPGKNVYSLIPAAPDGTLTQLTFLKNGAVFKPSPSHDGKKILFSMRQDGDDWFNLYEMNIDGTGLRQLTAGPFNDFAGVYLPDGRIVFVSDRTGYLEEYHEERTECLFVMNGDGTGLHQITFAPGTYFEPSIMKDGRILFSFWDAFQIDVPPIEKHETYLMTVNPDGTEERHLFGASQYAYFQRERHGGIGFTQAREMPDGRILCQSEFGPSLIELKMGLDVEQALSPIFPGTTSIQLGGTGHAVHLSPLGTRSTANPLPDGRILFSKTEPGVRDSAIAICDPATRTEKVVFDIPNYAEFDAVPILLEPPRARIAPKRIAAPEKYSSGCVWEGDGTRAAESADNRGLGDTLARFLIVAGHESDQKARSEALQKARYLRVIEAEYTGVTPSSHTNLETRILGVVPMLPDGSAYFEAPADTPIYLDPLDAGGNRILSEWSYPNTSVPQGRLYPITQIAYMVGRAGETKACYGCHAPQTQAAPNVSIAALQYPPVRVSRELTDLQYRRNEPENYRRQARIAENEKYRPWLGSPDPWLRARASEMMMYLEDGTKLDIPRIAELLKDETLEVRRAAALALTRLAGPDQSSILNTLSHDDSDWLVRFHAKNALLAIGAIQDKSISPLEQIGRKGPKATISERKQVLNAIQGELPPIEAIRAAGRLRLKEAVPTLANWIDQHEWEYHAAEAAVALGRIGTKDSIDVLRAALHSEVPLKKKTENTRYFKYGPRPEEYALLQGLILADAKIAHEDVPYIIALLPNAHMEKPRFEDRMRTESQRVLMPRILLERAGLRKPIVDELIYALAHSPNDGNAAIDYSEFENESGFYLDSSLAELIIRGINLDRPFDEHHRHFDKIDHLGAEESLWLLTCLARPGEVSESLILPHLRSVNPRNSIHAADLLGLQGFGLAAEEALLQRCLRPYPFPEIWSIGKGMPDSNTRDRAYMAQSLAMHVSEIDRLRPIADPKRIYRDVRYGLVRGLARRGQPDAIPLLLEIASSDPLTLIRQQARYALSDIQDACRIRGETVPPVILPDPEPLESHFPPQPFTWADTTPDSLPVVQPPRQAGLSHYLIDSNFHNLNMAQARGAERMLIRNCAQTVRALDSLDNEKEVINLLSSPYPVARYYAARAVASHKLTSAVPVLINRLKASKNSFDPVGFWSSCDALARLRAEEAVSVLARFATERNPRYTHGPAGMPAGYVAARSLAFIVADAEHPEVARLLDSPNIWLRAGALRGLAESDVPGNAQLLNDATREDNPALVRTEARIQLNRTQQ